MPLELEEVTELKDFMIGPKFEKESYIDMYCFLAHVMLQAAICGILPLINLCFSFCMRICCIYSEKECNKVPSYASIESIKRKSPPTKAFTLFIWLRGHTVTVKTVWVDENCLQTWFFLSWTLLFVTCLCQSGLRIAKIIYTTPLLPSQLPTTPSENKSPS